MTTRVPYHSPQEVLLEKKKLRFGVETPLNYVI